MINITPQELQTILKGVCSQDTPSLAPWLALFGTILTVTVAALTVILNKSQKQQEIILNESQKNQEILLNSLEFLSGGTQKRAVGIALAKELGKNADSREVIIPVLQAQRRYISTKAISKQMDPKERAVEDLNLENIDRILKHWGFPPPVA